MDAHYLTFIVSIVIVAGAALGYGWWNSWDYDRTWKKNHPDPDERV